MNSIIIAVFVIFFFGHPASEAKTLSLVMPEGADCQAFWNASKVKTMTETKEVEDIQGGCLQVTRKQKI